MADDKGTSLQVGPASASTTCFGGGVPPLQGPANPDEDVLEEEAKMRRMFQVGLLPPPLPFLSCPPLPSPSSPCCFLPSPSLPLAPFLDLPPLLSLPWLSSCPSHMPTL